MLLVLVLADTGVANLILSKVSNTLLAFVPCCLDLRMWLIRIPVSNSNQTSFSQSPAGRLMTARVATHKFMKK
jgi:hypothetical protein